MSERETKMVTEREAVLRERKAWLDAKRADVCTISYRRELEAKAAEKFPLPRIVRPRVVPDPHNHEPQWGKPREWMCKDGQLYSRTVGLREYPHAHEPFAWTTKAQIPPTPQRVALWAALLASPTEEVPDDGTSHD